MVNIPLISKKEKKEVVPDSFTSVSKLTMPVQSQENTGLTAEDISLIIEEWLKENYVRFKTLYSSKSQVKAITRIQAWADRYNVRCTKKYLHEFRVGLLSYEGLSGKQLVEILRERLNTITEEKTVSKGVEKFFE